jgi:DNA-binding IclR family transcriptional regulator
MDRALERLFPKGEDHAAALQILEVLFEQPDRVIRGEDVLRQAGVPLMQGLVILARLTHEGLIQRPKAGAYSVGRITELNAG